MVGAISYFPLYLIKHWGAQKTYLQAIMPILGLGHFIRGKSLSKLLLPLVILFAYSMVQGIIYQNIGSILRGGQGLAMVFFADFLSQYFKQKEVILFIKSSLILSLIYFLSEWLFLSPLPPKEIFSGVTLLRFSGLIGESNFSALFIFTLATFALYFRRYLLFFISVLMMLPLMSRMGYILLLLLPIFGALANLRLTYLRVFVYFLLTFIVLSPLIIGLLDSICTVETCLKISELTNGRFAIGAGYWKMFLDNPFGVGFYNGPAQILKYLPAKYPLEPFQYHQHSMYVQTMSELGIIGSLILIFFLFKMTIRVVNQDRRFCLCWLLLLIGLMSLNAFSEFTFYMFIAWIVSGSDRLAFKFFRRNANPSRSRCCD